VSCACKRRATTKFKWTNGSDVVVYDSEMAAKAKVMRKGGSYKPVEG
jgi:hypothetical protein